ncbi:hypothetical protein Vadar_015812 [Vaccinium darrowii]|uniref:Uncharacterized protein n=1 Tax=Vaccinium darrowii TaxID=229202 RepID=A0ACB7YDS2_9ERIC|nr:hypothetical protein Vadar_015812 [Vaccinium darrowii]
MKIFGKYVFPRQIIVFGSGVLFLASTTYDVHRSIKNNEAPPSKEQIEGLEEYIRNPEQKQNQKSNKVPYEMEADRRPPPPPLPDPPPVDHRRSLIGEELEGTHWRNSKWKQTRLQSVDKLARVNRTPSKRDLTH